MLYSAILFILFIIFNAIGVFFLRKKFLFSEEGGINFIRRSMGFIYQLFISILSIYLLFKYILPWSAG